MPTFRITTTKAPRTQRLPRRMAALCLLASLLVAPTHASEQVPPTETNKPAYGVLYAGDRDWLLGELVEITTEGTIKWRHNTSQTIISFPKNSVQSLHFSAQLPPPPYSDVVWMHGQSSIHGTIISMDDSTLILETNYADNIQIPRNLIRGFQFADGGEKIVFDELGPLDQWTTHNSNPPSTWQMPNPRTLVFDGSSTESIKRDLNIPDIATIEFDLSWKSALNTNIIFLQNYQDNNERDFYVANITNGHLFWQRSTRAEGRNRQITLGRVQLSEHLQSRSSAHFRISIDRTRKKIVVFINGERTSEWNDTADGVPAGNGIEIRGSSENPLRIRNLIVREWNGRSTPLDFKEANPSSQTVDSVETADDDLHLGEILRVTRNPDGQRTVELATPLVDGGILKIPEHPISQIILASDPPDEDEEEHHTGNPVRILLEDGSQLPARPISASNDTFRFLIFDNPDPIEIPVARILRIDYQQN